MLGRASRITHPTILSMCRTSISSSCIQNRQYNNAQEKGKDDYSAPNAYRPIAFLNTLRKVMESIMPKKITYLAETHRLLANTQMGARRVRSTESALELLTEQIHTVLGRGTDKVASLLSIDVAGAYNTVTHQRLIHNFRKRKIPKCITDWVNSFLNKRSTSLAFTAESRPYSI